MKIFKFKHILLVSLMGILFSCQESAVEFEEHNPVKLDDNNSASVVIDSDNDGIPDIADRDSNPSLADFDGDGVADIADADFIDNIALPDADGDGIIDKYDLINDPDSDNDGIPDYADLDVYPNLPDADGDGIADVADADHASNGAALDDDGDGIINDYDLVDNSVANSVAVAANITPPSFNEDSESIITLNYSDVDSDLATACSVTGLTNSTISTACTCTVPGVCTVGITGNANYYGAESFNYTVTTNAVVSNTATSNFTISAVDDVAVAANINPASFNEDTEGVITLSYTDQEAHPATACSVTALTNSTISTACACTVPGVCTVGITGNANYYGAESFNYTVTTNAVVSNTATSNFTISAVDDVAVAANLTPANIIENTEGVITLSYTDTESHPATTCSVTGLTNSTVSTACSCTIPGVCTVGVTGNVSYTGAESFSYTVTTNAVVSNTATSTYTIVVGAPDNAPVAEVFSPSYVDVDTEKIMTLVYTDGDNDLATACTVSGLSGITESQVCACNASGICTVGLTGTAAYTGAAAFSFTVTANSVVSNTAAINYTIAPLYVAGAPDNACINPPIAASAPFQSGDGTIGTPYIICDAAQLQAVNTQAAEYYILGADIDLSSISNFVPIGGCGGDYNCNNFNEDPFEGSFDGNGRTIFNLNMSASKSGVGLFGYVDSAAVITNFRLIQADIDVDNTAANLAANKTFGIGGIVGMIGENTTAVEISDLYFKGNITVNSTNNIVQGVGGILGHGSDQYYAEVEPLSLLKVGSNTSIFVNGPSIRSVGGVVGTTGYDYFGGIILKQSYSKADIKTNGTIVSGVGGVVGYIGTYTSTNQVEEIYSAGSITAESNNVTRNVGGLVGYSYTGGIDDSFSRTNINLDSVGSNDIGGLVGRSYYTSINNSFSSGVINFGSNSTGTTQYIGGLVGYQYNNTNQSFSTVTLTNDHIPTINNWGGLVGYLYSSGSLTTSYTTSDNTECVDGASNAGCMGDVPLASFQGTSANTNAPLNTWDFTTIWETVPGDYPKLRFTP
jgi:hypothetical protein